jgi:hypothetical protein
MYISQDTLRSLKKFENQAVIAIKAPPGTTLEVPDPDEGMQPNQRRFQCFLKAPDNQGPVDVFLVQDGHPEGGAGGNNYTLVRPRANPASQSLPASPVPYGTMETEISNYELEAATMAARAAIAGGRHHGSNGDLNGLPQQSPLRRSTRAGAGTNAGQLLQSPLIPQTPPSNGHRYGSSLHTDPTRSAVTMTPAQQRMLAIGAGVHGSGLPSGFGLGTAPHSMAGIPGTPLTDRLGMGLSVGALSPVTPSAGMILHLSPSRLVKLTPGMKIDGDFSFNIDEEGSSGISDFFAHHDEGGLGLFA